MATKIAELRRLSQMSLDRMVAVKKLAEAFGYTEAEAKCLALGAIDRLRQGGRSQYYQKLRRIRRKTAEVGNHWPAAYDRLVNGRVIREVYEGRYQHSEHRNWDQVGRREVRLLNPKVRIALYWKSLKKYGGDGKMKAL